jgi:hypothetical protein
MSYIDNIRNKAAIAGTSIVPLSGNEIIYLLNYVAAQAPAPGGSGLAVTGLDNGATVQDQPFLNGVTVGSAGAINGVLNFKNAPDSSTVTISSNADKELLIDNSGHNLSLGINTAPVSGVALAVGGEAIRLGISADFSQGLIGSDNTTGDGIFYLGDYVNDSNGTKIIGNDFAQTVAVTAANGFSTSAGMTVGTTIKTSGGYEWDLGGYDAGGTYNPDGNAIAVTIDGVTYRLATAT